MSRRVYLLGVGIALVALAFAITNYIMGPSPGVTEANSRRIQKGMTLKEVQAIFGGPGKLSGEGGGLAGGMVWRHSLFAWEGTHGTALVSFGNSGWYDSFKYDAPQVVKGVTFRRAAGPDPLARLRAWLGW